MVCYPIDVTTTAVIGRAACDIRVRRGSIHRLEATVGETIRIVNEDDRGHLVGPFFVPAQTTLNQTFSSPGEFIGECTVHPSGEIRVIISA